MGNLSDNDIIDGILEQSERVLKYLYRTWFKMVKNHILKNGGTEEDSYDVFQDSIIVLYQQIIEKRLKPESDLKGYFFGIVRNKWHSDLRRKSRMGQLDFDVVEEQEENDFSDPVFLSILSRSLNKLKPDCREILNLFYEGVPYDEIAKRLNLKNEVYARRKKYLCKEALMELIKSDPEYIEYQRFLK